MYYGVYHMYYGVYHMYYDVYHNAILFSMRKTFKKIGPKVVDLV